VSSGLHDQIDLLLQDPKIAAPGEVRLALARIANEVHHRLSNGSSDSYDFLTAATKTLARMRGSNHAEARLACLYDCVTYFFATPISGRLQSGQPS
jgi:hypothetical protein